MDYKRARQIVDSDETIQVQYKGKPVWIENLIPGGEAAKVSTDTETLTVPVGELSEGSA